jgi:hypothetical protein
MIKKMTDQEYFNLDACSASQLKTIYAKSVLHSIQEHKRTESMEFGTAFHCLILEPAFFDERYCVFPEEIKGEKPDYRKTEHKKFKADFEEKNAGKIFLSFADHCRLLAMGKALMNSPLSAQYLHGGQSEVVITHDLGEIDATKIKMDYVNFDKHIIVDLKTCQDASPWAIKKDIFKFGYDIQAAWYKLQYVAETGVDPKFIFCFVEVAHPYAISWVELSTENLLGGLSKAMKANGQYMDFRASGIPQGYSEELVTI